MPNNNNNTTSILPTLAHQERALTFSHFTCEHAWVIGNILRNTLRTSNTPALLHISLAASSTPYPHSLSFSAPPALPQTLFHAPSLPGMMPFDEARIARLRATVLRWGHSSWYMRCKYGGDAEGFARGMGLAEGERGVYAIEGGGWPVFVKGVEGVVGVIAVVLGEGENGDEGGDGDGDGGERAHAVVVRALEEYRELREGFKSPLGRTVVGK